MKTESEIESKPGPWRTNPTTRVPGGWRTVIASRDAVVMTIRQIGKVTLPEAKANAERAAAAPELLEALTEALPWVEAHLDDPVNKPGKVRTVVSRIRAAIADAEGRKP